MWSVGSGGGLNDVCRRVFGIPRGLNDVGGGLDDVCRRVFGIPRDLNDIGGGLNDVCRRVFGIPRGLNDVGGCLNDVCRRIFGIPSESRKMDFVTPKAPWRPKIKKIIKNRVSEHMVKHFFEAFQNSEF